VLRVLVQHIQTLKVEELKPLDANDFFTILLFVIFVHLVNIRVSCYLPGFKVEGKEDEASLADTTE
jgi:hypothetical protein